MVGDSGLGGTRATPIEPNVAASTTSGIGSPSSITPVRSNSFMTCAMRCPLRRRRRRHHCRRSSSLRELEAGIAAHPVPRRNRPGERGTARNAFDASTGLFVALLRGYAVWEGSIAAGAARSRARAGLRLSRGCAVWSDAGGRAPGRAARSLDAREARCHYDDALIERSATSIRRKTSSSTISPKLRDGRVVQVLLGSGDRRPASKPNWPALAAIRTVRATGAGCAGAGAPRRRGHRRQLAPESSTSADKRGLSSGAVVETDPRRGRRYRRFRADEDLATGDLAALTGEPLPREARRLALAANSGNRHPRQG